MTQNSVSFSCQSKQDLRCCINFAHELTCQILTNHSIKIGRRAWPTRDELSSLPVIDTVFIIQTLDRKQYFTILQYKLSSFNIQDERSMRGLLAMSPLRPAGSHFSSASVWMNINRSTLLHNKEFIMFIFYSVVLSMCNL